MLFFLVGLFHFDFHFYVFSCLGKIHHTIRTKIFLQGDELAAREAIEQHGGVGELMRLLLEEIV